MSEVERAEAELNLAQLGEQLEAARTAMEGSKTPENIEAYRAVAQKVFDARAAFRMNHRDPSGAAQPAVVEAEAASELGG